jgi:hypothetical protein
MSTIRTFAVSLTIPDNEAFTALDRAVETFLCNPAFQVAIKT